MKKIDWQPKRDLRRSLAQRRNGPGTWAAHRRSHQSLDGRQRLDASAGADAGAVQRGCGAGKVELARQGPALQQTVDKAGVEDVAGAGGVHYVHLIGADV